MEDRVKCDYCGCELEEDNKGSETTCITCWEFWESEFENDYEEENIMS